MYSSTSERSADIWMIILPMNTAFWYHCVLLISYKQTNGTENETEGTTLTLSANMRLAFAGVQAVANELQVLCRPSCQGQEGRTAPRAQLIYVRSAASFSCFLFGLSTSSGADYRETRFF